MRTAAALEVAGSPALSLPSTEFLMTRDIELVFIQEAGDAMKQYNAAIERVEQLYGKDVASEVHEYAIGEVNNDVPCGYDHVKAVDDIMSLWEPEPTDEELIEAEAFLQSL